MSGVCAYALCYDRQMDAIVDWSMNMICESLPTAAPFHDPDAVQTRLEQGIRSRSDAVDGDCCVRARGLPWQASDQDIARFFVGLNVAR